jgi:hypothetical protein
MESSGWHILDVAKERPSGDVNVKILYPDGTLAGSIGIYPSEQADGSVRAQLELRFEDLASAFVSSEVGMDTSRHATGRTWVLVEMEPRQSFTDPLRFSIHIPGNPGPTGEDVRNAKDALAAIVAAREAIQKVREGCRDPEYRDYFVRLVDAIGATWKLADDGSEPSLVTLAALALHASDSGS